MEVQCPRCESTFAVDPLAVEEHQGLLRCSVCGQVFELPVSAPALAKTFDRERRGGSPFGRFFLLLIIFLLLFVLIVQVLWWTRSYAYLATSAPIRTGILRISHSLGVNNPWPGPNRDLIIVKSSVTPLPNHLVVIRGELANHSGMVQRYPVIQVVLSNAYGSTIRTLTYTPAQYLPTTLRAQDGFLPGKVATFALQGPELAAAAGYQVTLLTQP